MISNYIYVTEQRSFSILSKSWTKKVQSYRSPKFKSKLGKALTPIVDFTSFKFTPLPSIYSLTIDEGRKKREIQLMDRLKSLCIGVPVIRARKLDNACYLPQFDKIISEYNFTDEDIMELCKEWGMDFDEFKSNLGPHMVVLGDKYANACILAHEFGHYKNTIGEGELEGKILHEKYGPHGQSADINYIYAMMINGVGNLCSIYGAVKKSKAGATSAAVASASSAILKGISVHYGNTVIKAEQCATQTGLKMLTEIKTTQEEWDAYRLNLEGALDTYIKYYRSSRKGSMWIDIIKAISEGLIAVSMK